MKMDAINQKATMLEEEKTCVSNSKDKDGLKKCMKDMHSKMESMHQDMKKKM